MAVCSGDTGISGKAAGTEVSMEKVSSPRGRGKGADGFAVRHSMQLSPPELPSCAWLCPAQHGELMMSGVSEPASCRCGSAASRS